MSLSSLSGTIHRARSHLNLTRFEFELATPLRGAGTLAPVADHVIEQLRRWLPVHRQAVGILILADRLGRALAIDAIGRSRIVAKPQQRRLRVVDEIGARRRARNRRVAVAFWSASIAPATTPTPAPIAAPRPAPLPPPMMPPMIAPVTPPWMPRSITCASAGLGVSAPSEHDRGGDCGCVLQQANGNGRH